MKSTDEIAARLADLHGISKKDARAYVDTILDAVKGEVAAGDGVNLSGFGKIIAKTIPAREGRNPQTGAVVNIPAKRKPVFKPAKAFSEALA